MRARRHALVASALAACLAFVPGAAPGALAGDEGSYVAGATVVARDGSVTTVDEGVVVCNDLSGVGVGGFCVGFGGGDSVALTDLAAGENVAFQVCVDNSGDGLCTSPEFGPCADVIAFSHDDGHFYNPVGPLPTGFAPGCSGGFPGYVVFICQGVHGTDLSPPHAHPATGGTGVVTTGGEGSGDFCGGTRERKSGKPYLSEHVTLAPDLVAQLDPAVCAAVARLAGSYGVAEVEDDGDVYVDGTQAYDCPPYGA